MGFIADTMGTAWKLLLDSSIYILFGLMVSEILGIFISPASVGRHLGKGKFKPVFKAALFGIPIPLCSCGVLPAAISIKKQGANNGAITAFLISTPESGVDSIAITYALIDPIMTIARPLAAFITATTAGILVNIFAKDKSTYLINHTDLSCITDACCEGSEASIERSNKDGILHKINIAVRHSINEVWGDIAPWFFLGLILAGLITALIPVDAITRFMGKGILSMLTMLAVGIPMYICASASTPIAAALILKGVSPGAALVFLLAGPATNVTSLTVLLGILGKRATAIYLATISVSVILFGMLLDLVYSGLNISARAMVSQSAEVIPPWLQWISAGMIVAISILPVYRSMASVTGKISFWSKGKKSDKQQEETNKSKTGST